MGDREMLGRLLEQLNIKNEELHQAENGREKLREENEERRLIPVIMP